MKVVKKGENINGRTMRVSCKWCKAVLDVSAEELEREINEEERTVYSFKCPECKGDNQLRAYALSDNIINDLRRLKK